ncbi:DNA-binding transcriptional regulator, LysR family [Pseudomonas sp. 43mfcvi1.1]|uniref:LysR family transcriptional regulator n=1 Tax=Pseudomonas sp. 43mfcvi1.1 TaxID=1761894 RepID=UPI000D6C11E3|nr:LysR family transcriptional regulator [Pseudomonas sp. 43mfcvi1.1]PWJ38993.1 LysR family transcriptional regulator [Pseudomonas sp. 43mfcvi1.1]SSB96257.1 DNA-binding transcriptional regulator, LysR family [Pseudomonas sp. 43mfcvi1.1]
MITLDSRHTDEFAALLALESQGSFVAAARLLQRHPTIISKRLAALEARLGVRLLERSTRHIRLTDAGARLVRRLRLATELMVEAEQEATSGAAKVRGNLRLAVPAAMGRLWLAPILPEFLAAHPHLTLTVDYSERLVDVIAEGFDVAIRLGELNDSRLIAKRLGDHRRILCASPGYIERHGWPASPAELVNHNCLGFTGLASYPEWKLIRADEHFSVHPQGSLVSNDSEALLSATIAGTGILGAGEWLFSRALANKELVRVLPDWELGAKGGIYLIRPSAKFASSATLALKEWLEGKLVQTGTVRAA